MSLKDVYVCVGSSGVANKTAPALVLRDGDRDQLESILRSTTLPAGLVQRARIVLLASAGVANYEIADRVGVSRPTVNLWRGRYTERGLAGLSDEKRPGRPRTVDRSAVITATLTPPPTGLGVTHWSSRLLAARLGLEHSTVAAIWADYGVKPWKEETFKFSTDPELEAKVVDVVGLYLAPPENAVVLCVDAKSQIQALNRTQKTLPMQPGHAEPHTTEQWGTHDYVTTAH